MPTDRIRLLAIRLVLVVMVSSTIHCDPRKDGGQCGPNNLCSCSAAQYPYSRRDDSALEMDCSKRNVRLRDVCMSIGMEYNVVELDVSLVKLHTISEVDLIGCQRVVSLDMKHCAISDIDDKAFKGMDKLKSIDLSGNNLQQYYKGYTPTFFNPLVGLVELGFRILNEKTDLNTNQTLSYPNLPAMKQLESLQLDGLPNTSFSQTYKSLANLKNLTLSGTSHMFCCLGDLTGKTFENVPHVENLFIKLCQVTRIEAETFEVLGKLKRLDISLNRQLGLEPLNNLWYGLQFTNIEFVNYSRNCNTFGLGQMITKQDMCYLRNTTVKEVALDGLKLELFETNALLLIPESLNVVHLNDNRFTFGLYLLQLACCKNVMSIESNFQNFAHKPNMYTREHHETTTQCRKDITTNCPFLDEEYLMNVSRFTPNCQYFNETPESLVSAPLPNHLKYISFSDSKLDYAITKVPIFPLRNKIEHADFSGNIFYKLLGPIGPITSLKYLKISRNYCTCIGQQFFIYMMELEELHADKNLLGEHLSLSSSTEMFMPLGKLRLLNVSGNQIKELCPTIFTHLASLEVLDMSCNSIDKWTLDTGNLRNLSQLHLRSNSLETLPNSIIDHLTDMLTHRGKNFTIDLRDNPIRYSCTNRRFLAWMSKHEGSFVGLDDYTFYDDSGTVLTADQYRHDIQYIDKMCRSYTVSIVMSTVGISVFMSVVISGLVYKNRWKLRYFLYMKKARYWGYRSYEPLDQFKYDAFISYSDENSTFRDEILKEFEDDSDLGMKPKLCIHERDFRPGRAITENIIDAIQSSKKTVIVLSKAYLKSKWCMYEFHMTRMESIYSRSGSGMLVIVMLESVPLDDNMPLELMQWIRQDSYLEYTNDEQGRQVFWNKLRDSILD